MAEGWKQFTADLREALGLKRKTSPAESEEQAHPPDKTTEPARDGGAPSASLAASPAEPTSVGVAPNTEAQAAPETEAVTPLQKLYSYAGLAVALLAAIAMGWYVYFGGARPPAPDVVATFDGGQITVQQVQNYVTRIAPGAEAAAHQSYEGYRAIISSMVLDELVRRWADKGQLDRDAKFADAMRHVTESVTLEEWVAELHQSKMTAAVRESDIQSYFEANKAAYGDATLSEVRENIRETLAHQDQEQFFKDYIAKLRADATIMRDFELLDAPAPTEAQIKDYYDANRDKLTTPQRAVVDVIYVPPAAFGEESDAAARAKAEEALAALNAGRDIEEVAAKYSQTPYTPAGVVVEGGTDDPAMVEQAFALAREDDLSPVFRTQAGYYVLRLREMQIARTLSPEEARAQITAALRAQNERAWFEQNPDRTLFTIHGERYTLGQFYHEYQNLPPEFQAQYAGPEGMRQLTELLIDRLLVLDDAYDQLLDQKNTPLLEQARTLVLREMIHQAEVDRQVMVTDQEVKDYYEQHKELLAAPPEARIRAIRIYLGQTEDDLNRAWQRAEAAYKQLVPGLGADPADFDQVAREYDESDLDPADAGLGEWVRMGDDVLQNLSAHPLHTYLLNLTTGAVSQPFEFGDSIYVVKILERTDPVPLAFEEVEGYIRGELETQQHRQLDSELAARLLRDAHFAIYDQVILQMLEADQAAQAIP